MDDVHLGTLDMNLIVALDALPTERSVTRAAARIGITQSAASHALARRRKLDQFVLPPSTLRMWPVMNEAWSDAGGKEGGL